ncbi:hypothetical protein [Ponticaulis profundi]|uniref:Uncharacterized protein n=1 Tax=Ponticaulis profundi TaxID=2665222 RepID=A0ABW1SEX1_9PROT
MRFQFFSVSLNEKSFAQPANDEWIHGQTDRQIHMEKREKEAAFYNDLSQQLKQKLQLTPLLD